MDYSNVFIVAFLIGVHLCFLASWVSAENAAARSPSTESTACGSEFAPPVNLTITFDGDDNLTATWISDASTPMVGHLVQWCWGSSCKHEDVDECGDEYMTSNTEFHIYDVQPLTSYTVSVSSYRESVHKEKCRLGAAIACIATPRGIPRQVTDLKASTVKKDSISIEWTGPKPRNKIPVSYRVIWEVTDSGCITEGCVASGNASVTRTTFTVTDILPFTRICFTVAPFIEVLRSDVHGNESTLCVRSLPLDETLEVQDITTTGLTLSWKEQSQASIYSVQSCVRTGPCAGLDFDTQDCVVQNETTETPQFSWNGLAPWTSVLVKIRPYGTLGIGCFTTLVERPGSPGGLKVSDITSTSAVLSWTAPQDCNGPIDAYFISVVIESTRVPTGLEVDGKKTEAKITSLHPWTKYVVAVGAVNLNASMTQLISSNRPKVTFTTLPGPPSPPMSLVTVVKSRSVTAFWEEPQERNGPKGSLKYKVLIKKAVASVVPTAELETENTRIQYDQLEPFTQYVISVSAITKYQGQVWESESITEELQTDPEAPDVVQDLEADCESEPNVVKLTWKPPLHSYGIVQGYNIALSGKKKQKPTIRRTVNVGAGLSCHRGHCAFELHKVYAEYSYVITIRAKNKDMPGFGAMKEIADTCIVPAAAPPPPQKDLILQADPSWTDNNLNQQHQITFGFWNDTFSDIGGDIIAYDILVSLDVNFGSRTRCSTWGKVHVHGFISCYVASPEYWNPFSADFKNDAMNCMRNSSFVRCTLGVADGCDPFEDRCNGPLKSGTSYGIVLRAYTAAGFQDTEPRVFVTAKADYSEFNHRVMLAGVTLLAVILLAVIFTIFCYFFVNRKCCWEAHKPAVIW
ncbi:phosphatidylinositol phosphatase PTPRQ-like [Ornithodoros turicata]|uniref:phosphatidylinositol phosphatase PTPRQ-like n=1 Tax=Ornithodoros turicata TaxID=34597 RepID=UPI003138FBFB